jgi:hypothetical protein
MNFEDKRRLENHKKVHAAAITTITVRRSKNDKAFILQHNDSPEPLIYLKVIY